MSSSPSIPRQISFTTGPGLAANIGVAAALGAVSGMVSCSSKIGMALNGLELANGAMDVGRGATAPSVP
ncbi:hypothetical protein [Planctomicrobium sp. SH664]|uniref:hypothetical protein n=1 Tax=Planctomicrobium sp. SH664 TaxID=3448125 RepID=UPI003F5BBC74